MAKLDTVLEAYIGSSLVPTIMSINAGKLFASELYFDMFYITITAGQVISSLISSLYFSTRFYARTRNQLVLLLASLLTTSLVSSIACFHSIRLNLKGQHSYKLPATLEGNEDVFRYHLHTDLIPGLIIFSQTILCSLIRNELMYRAKRTFTFGEAAIVSQLSSSAYLVWALSCYSKLTGAGPFQLDQTTDLILNIGMSLFGLIFLPFYLNLIGKTSTAKYCLLAAGGSTCYIVSKNIITTSRIDDPFTWLIDYIFSTHQRLSLFSLWLSTLAACVSLATSWTRMVGQTNCLVRKVFHLALCVVFISGYNQDIHFTSFAAGGMLTVTFLLEIIRVWNLYPIGGHLEKVCSALRGKWDNRYLTLSHMYLLVGIMLPLWILPRNIESQNKLSISSGLISVGVGDTAAAVVGTFYGKLRIGKSGKTAEGFLGNIISMQAFKLVWIGYSDLTGELSFFMVASFTAFAEIISRNCDNLMLPLVMLLFLEIF